jgi:tRNA 2-thiouridine synthesizing protein E
MGFKTFSGKRYEVDALGYLIDFNAWDEDFAIGSSPGVSIEEGLTKEHWDIIYFIRDTVRQLGVCPLVYQTVKMSGLPLKKIERLFPTGYLRGACKLAGVTYREAYTRSPGSPGSKEDTPADVPGKTYEVDIMGFLVDSDRWDPGYAAFKAQEMGMPVPLSEKHWEIINFLRKRYAENRKVPTIYETCDATGIGLQELEGFFPQGYHRGAVKVAGLRAR